MVVEDRTIEELRAELEALSAAQYDGDLRSLQVLGAHVHRDWALIRRLNEGLNRAHRDGLPPSDELVTELRIFMECLRHEAVRAYANIRGREQLKQRAAERLAAREGKRDDGSR